MASPAKNEKKLSSADHCLISSATIGENQQQSLGSSFETAFGEPAEKMENRILRKIWICSDVWMDIFPLFGRVELGLKLAMLSDRFDALVDAHFDGKSEWPICKRIEIHKDKGMPELTVTTNFYTNSVRFPLPDHSLHNKILFRLLKIQYIDYSVIAFLRSNQQIWDKGTDLDLFMPYSHTPDGQPIWDVFVREIWPTFSTNIRRLQFHDGDHLDNLRRFISPTILTDLDQLIAINSYVLMPDMTGDFDGPNATAGQILSKWLHIPRKDGMPKKLYCLDQSFGILEWVNNFKKKFLYASTSVRYKIQFTVCGVPTSMVPFELVNERTNEKLLLTDANEYKCDNRRWMINRCQIGETAAIQWDKENWDNFNTVQFTLSFYCIGPLSPPATGQSSEKGV